MRHLRYEDRLKIEAMLNAKVKKIVIANTLGFAYSTIRAEIKRGMYTRLDTYLRPYQAYSADIAQQNYDYLASAKGSQIKLANDYEFVNFISKMICKYKYSPYAALILARKQGFKTDVCLSTLYNYIHQGLILGVTQSHMPYAKRKRTYKHVSRKAVRNALYPRINERPEEAEFRSCYGHWEMDTVYSGKKKSKTTLLVLTERKTLEEIIIQMPDRTQLSVKRALDRLEWSVPGFSEKFKTITCDNGTEFSPEVIETSIHGGKRTSCFFCHPFSSFERGSNENANKLIRRHLPKGVSLRLRRVLGSTVNFRCR